MTNNRLSTSSSASSGAGAGLERRRAPRIAPLSSDVYSSSVMSVKNSSLEELKARPRRPGEASFFYLDHHFQHNAVKVLPGEYFVSDENLVIMTVLGSCIAACLWDSRSRVGGMNHFMLPDGDMADASGRYGSYAMEVLINEMLKLGARRETMQAKIFGGAQVMHNFTTMNVGVKETQILCSIIFILRESPSCQRMCWIFIRGRLCFFQSQEKQWSSDWRMRIQMLHKRCGVMLYSSRKVILVDPWICFD